MNLLPFLALPAFIALVVLLSQIVFYVMNKIDDKRPVSKDLQISELDLGTDAFYFNHANVFALINSAKYPKIQFDYSLESIKQLESSLDQLSGSRTYFSQDFITGFGCYFGETIVRQIGGEWKSDGTISIFNAESIQPMREIQIRFFGGYQGRLSWLKIPSVPSLIDFIEQIQVAKHKGLQKSN